MLSLTRKILSAAKETEPKERPPTDPLGSVGQSCRQMFSFGATKKVFSTKR
ncbi:MAG: hypothetical protein IKP08_06665 [Bacteroidales bacterium]|nr:hypothetical protein [Bacteroidales bacterium]